eukprot:6702891-Pyramimonas_sp.AAC.1
MSSHPSHGSWPDRERHRRHQWQVPLGAAAPCRHPPHTVRGLIGGSTEGPSGKASMAPPPNFGTTLTRFVAPAAHINAFHMCLVTELQ